jgi:hypothetical protein
MPEGDGCPSPDDGARVPHVSRFVFSIKKGYKNIIKISISQKA